VADVFLSYRRADKDKAHALAKALRVEGLDVWWDADLNTGETFDAKVQKLLHEDAKAVIVVWSETSVKSEWVRAEASVGRERGILVPVMVRRCVVPVPFNVLQTADLTNWSGDRAHPVYRNVVKQTKELCGKTNVPPLRPPPNPALRTLWRALAAVAVVAAIGASVWLFRPWEAIQQANDPVVQARKARDASIARLAAFGVSAQDFEHMEARQLVKNRFKPETYPDLVKAAEAGDAAAQALLCMVALTSDNPSAETAQAAQTNCRLSSDAGEPVGQFYYSILMANTGEGEAAALLVKSAADKGYDRARLRYARALIEADGVPRDPAQAEQILLSLQTEGMPEAEYLLGLFTFEGRFGREPDRREGIRLITLAADKGLQAARYELGMKYADGFGVPQDFAKARAFLEAAAAHDDNLSVAERAKSGLVYVDGLERDAARNAATPPN
jgi:hypothetical protein